ncbi:MAG: hypothetical protein WEA10_04980 [Actinomycetota bacterium]
MMVEVAVKVPTDHVGEFYSMYGLWLQRVQRGDTGDTEAGTGTRQQWTTEDGDLAAQMWPDLPANCVKMLEFVIEQGSTDAMPVVEALGLKDPTQIVGVHGWIGRVCAQYGRKSPIKAKATPNGTVWSIDPGIGSMLREARKA